jgi:hypothetical protein
MMRDARWVDYTSLRQRVRKRLAELLHHAYSYRASHSAPFHEVVYMTTPLFSADELGAKTYTLSDILQSSEYSLTIFLENLVAW